MALSEIAAKIKRRIWREIVEIARNSSHYPKIYKSYWHSLFYNSIENNGSNFYTAIPNPGAGIGHQLANWIAGYWFSKQFGLHFAHTSFSNMAWERFLGFGKDETSVKELLRNGYKKVRLPIFNEYDSEEVDLNKKIIDSYQHQKVVFVAEQDQFYHDQYGVMDDLKNKFYGSVARKDDDLIYTKEQFNIAIHVRRGDIVVGQINQNPNLTMRWQDNRYFEQVLEKVLENLQTTKPIAIYLFSQGERTDFPEFERFNNIHYCLDLSVQDSFLHLVYADLIITSKSSFSYKPALLSNGIKVCPRNFWHGYPESNDWILVENDGEMIKMK